MMRRFTLPVLRDVASNLFWGENSIGTDLDGPPDLSVIRTPVYSIIDDSFCVGKMEAQIPDC
jgi:hypothetical protein